MITNFFTLLLVLFSISGFSQNPAFELPARQNPTVKKENLHRVQYINDLSPLLWSSMQLQLSADFWLYKRRVNRFTQPQPENYLYPQDDYKQILEVVFTEISVTTSAGKIVAAQSTSDKLTAQQKNILNTADPGTDIRVTLRYKYKDQSADSWGSRSNTVEGSTQLTIVPDTEAEYPGGWKQLSEYFAGHVIAKMTEPGAVDKVQMAIVKFTISEDGHITNAAIARSSSDTRIDQLLLEALNKMPKWKPAENSKGVRVKQQISIPFGVGC